MQEVQIYQPLGESYLVEYNPPLLNTPNGKKETIRIWVIPQEEMPIKFTNCRGAWQLKFLSKDRFKLSNNPLIIKEPIICIFERFS